MVWLHSMFVILVSGSQLKIYFGLTAILIHPPESFMISQLAWQKN